jgi:dihydrofolate reductase
LVTKYRLTASTNPIAVSLNTRPKYVASTTFTDPKWSDTTVLSGDVTAAVGELKAKPGGKLQAHGSGGLIRGLLNSQLVDEITLFVCPVIVGQGTRLFPTPARTWRSSWWNRSPPRRGYRSRSTDPPAARSTRRPADPKHVT